MGDDFRTSSLQKWRGDKMFGFGLAREVTEFARELGYKNSEIDTRARAIWPLYRDATRFLYTSMKLALPLKRRLRSTFGSC